MREPIVLSWSGGKDSVMALAHLWTPFEEDGFEVSALLTTITAEYDRVSMHGVRRVLVEAQAEALGLPLHPVLIPAAASNRTYEEAMEAALAACRARGVTTVAFADLFLEDIRRYREAWLGRLSMRAVFPIWGRPTRALAEQFIAAGFDAVTTCVDARVLDREFVGRRFDAEFLADLPPTVDPCGENGEFHTFVHDGPIFRFPVRARTGEIVRRESWYFCDLLPISGG